MPPRRLRGARSGRDGRATGLMASRPAANPDPVGAVEVSRPDEVSEHHWILVTNDDGVEAPGIARLTARLAAQHRVVTVAPDCDRSGSGTGIGTFDAAGGVPLTELDGPDTGMLSISGPPGLAVMSAALGAFGPSPRLVVSGINAGINTGHSVIHSGTVGAALTARTFGSHGLAVSLERSDPWHWETAAHIAADVAEWLMHRDGPPLVLNLNVPARPLEDLAGVRWGDLASFGYFQVAVQEPGRLEFEVRSRDESPPEGSDSALLAAGFASVTVLGALEAQPPPADSPPWIEPV